MVKLVDDGRAILSMRDTDFDTYSAYGEPIDNSVEANAKNVRLLFDIGKEGRKEIINQLAFVDDGDGMSSEILHRCMQLGYSSRFNERTGIGRFGVGMTLAAIHECKRVEVYSKIRGGEWMYTYTDIDEITSQPPKMENIPDPKPKALPEKYEEYSRQDSGTILIWKKYDRLKDTVSKVLEESEIWIGRTYRHFIWDGIEISINNKPIKAIDPLYVNTKKTKFPNDPPAEEFDPVELQMDVPDDANTDSTKSKVLIRYSLIDKKFRPKIGSGGSKEAKERYIDRNEGVSILRNKREVFYGEIPYWKPAFTEVDRWWGCEISFNAELDSLFAVKNIKRGAIPVGELKEKIKDFLNPFRKSMLKKVQRYRTEVLKREEQDEASKSEGAGISGKHKKATNIAKKTPKTKSKIDKEVDSNEAISEVIKKHYSDVPQDKIKALVDYFSKNEYVIDEKRWDSPNFVNIEHLGGKRAIFYNVNHPFFEKYFYLLSMVQDLEGDEKVVTDGILTLIDLLIISFSTTESQYEPNDQWLAEDFLEDIKLRWGQELNKLFKTWSNNEEDNLSDE